MLPSRKNEITISILDKMKQSMPGGRNDSSNESLPFAPMGKWDEADGKQITEDDEEPTAEAPAGKLRKRLRSPLP